MPTNAVGEVTPKSVFLSALYFITLIIVLYFLNMGIEYFFNNVMFRVLDWYNAKSFWTKILLGIICGTFVFLILFNALILFAFALNRLILSWFPVNAFNVIASFILTLANAIWLIVQLWKLPESYNKWIVFELMLLSYIILHLNYVIAMQYPKTPSSEDLPIYLRSSRRL